MNQKQEELFNKFMEKGAYKVEDLDKVYANSDPDRIELVKELEKNGIYNSMDLVEPQPRRRGRPRKTELTEAPKTTKKEAIKDEDDDNIDSLDSYLDIEDDEFIDDLDDEDNDDEIEDEEEEKDEDLDSLDDSEFYSGDDEEEIEQLEFDNFDDLINSEASKRNLKIVVSDPVKMYLKEIGRIDLLTPEKEKEIAKVIYDSQREIAEYNEKIQTMGYIPTQEEEEHIKKVQEEGEIAKKILTEANLRLVVNIAKHFSNPDMEFADLIQEGSIGLSKAVIKFDYTRGNKFSTYATGWIKQAITRAIADQARTIRIPVHMNETINKLNKCERELTHELGRKPSYEELSEKMGISFEKLMNIKRISQKTKSLEDPVGEEDDSSYGDFVPDNENPNPEEYAAQEALKRELNQLLSNLSDREERVIKLRFGLIDGRIKTLEEVGKEFGVTRERIRQIEAKALRKLRHPSRSNKLRDFLK